MRGLSRAGAKLDRSKNVAVELLDRYVFPLPWSRVIAGPRADPKPAVAMEG